MKLTHLYKNRIGSDIYHLMCWLIGILLTMGVAIPAMAENDELVIPAEKSDRATSAVMMDIAEAGSSIVVVGSRGIILISDDNGESWAQATVPVSVTLTSVTFPTAQNGWVVGHQGVILHSSDGGKTWQKQLDGSQINTRMLDEAARLCCIVKGKISNACMVKEKKLEQELIDLNFLVSDWESAVDEGPTKPFFDVWFHNKKEGLAIGSFGMIMETKNGGESWQLIIERFDNPCGHHYYGIASTGKRLFVVGEAITVFPGEEEYKTAGGMIFRSDDDGKNWKRLPPPSEGSLFGITCSRDGQFIITYGLLGAFCSTDNGETWKAIEIEEDSGIQNVAIFQDNSIWLISSKGNLFRSLDGARTFKKLTNGFPGGICLADCGSENVLLGGLNGIKKIDITSFNN